MPGLKCTYISYVVEKANLADLFGFFYCKIKCDNNRYLGLLPQKDECGLIFPSGEWEEWYFSEELKWVKENGYEIEVMKGYQFNRVKNVFFNDFVTNIMHIKQNPGSHTEKA